MREIPFGGDGDFSEARLRARYNGELANGIGNLVARVLTMVEKYAKGKTPPNLPLKRGGKIITPPLGGGVSGGAGELWQQYEMHMTHYALDRALDTIWELISECDRLIDREQPWQLAKQGDKTRLDAVLCILADSLTQVARMLIPFMPETAAKIEAQLADGKKTKPLFPRL